MKIGQKVFTTFYSRTNTTAIVSGEIEKHGYMEDGNIISEECVKITFADGKSDLINLIYLNKFEKNEDLPDMFHLPVSEQIEIQNAEAELLKKMSKNIEMKVSFSGANLPDIKRVFSGSRLECETLRDMLFKVLKNKGYSSVSSQG